jgi:hypothetical protein
VPDTVIGMDQPRGAIHHAEDVAFGAGLEAGEAADADVRIDDRGEA